MNNTEELDELIGRIATDNGVLVDKTDPVLIQVTIWNFLSRKLQDEIKNAHDTTIQNNIALFEDSINKNLMAASNDFENEMERLKEMFLDEIKHEQQILRKDAETTANSLVKSATEYLNQYSLIQIKKDVKNEIYKSCGSRNYFLLTLLMIEILHVIITVLLFVLR